MQPKKMPWIEFPIDLVSLTWAVFEVVLIIGALALVPSFLGLLVYRLMRANRPGRF